LFVPSFTEQLISSTLPDFITHLDLVFVSKRNNLTYTFELDGGTVSDVGQGDLHERGAVEGYGLGAKVGSNGQFEAWIYPREALRASYYSDTPRNACIGVVVVVVMVALMVQIYDSILRKRRRLLKNEAAVAHSIVDGAFPLQVQSRLFQMYSTQDIQPRGSLDQRAPRLSLAAAAGMEVMTTLGGRGSGSIGGSTRGGYSRAARQSVLRFMTQLAAAADIPRAPPATSAPNADRFDNCTVLFADLVKFTSWASLPPERVFEVLETVFRGFDEAAHRLQVFKVETIGDEWLGVTGLPIKQPETHATAMADFALQLQPRLADACLSLGLAEDQLQLRVGLHSGSVTAGVLRTERSRFQVFGDTVNTASRMESTGESGRIQVSAATEELLRKAATGRHALTMRGLVDVKGKGALETFWLTGVASPEEIEMPESGSAGASQALTVLEKQRLRDADAV